MGRPTTLGGTISVSDETALAALDPDGLPLGSSVYVTEDKLYFYLGVSGRPIAVEDTDSVVALTGTWTFANGNFRSTDVGATFTTAGCAEAGNNGEKIILTVVDSTTVTTATTDLVDETFDTGDTTCVLADAPLDEGSVVEVFGTVGVRWFVVAAGAAVASVTGSPAAVVDNTDPENPIVDFGNKLVTLGTIGTTLSITDLDGDVDSGYLIDFMLAINSTASSIAMTLNGATTNLISRGYEQSAASDPARVAGTSTWNVCDATMEADDFVEGRLWLPSKARGAGTRRAGWLDVYFGTGPTVRHMWFLYNDGTTNITSLAFVAVGANAFKAISYANVRKLRLA